MKLLVSDYDGTLKSDVKNLKININAIKKFMDEGNTFCIATGRPYNSIKEEIDFYNIPYNYLICNNGLTIFDDKNNLIYSQKLNVEDVVFFLKYMKADSENYSLYNAYGEVDNSDIIYASIDNLKLLRLRWLKREIKCWFDNVSVYGNFNKLYLESKTNKAIGIKKLLELEKLSFKHADIHTVGDCANDIEMLKEFNGHKVLFSYPCLFGKNIKTCTEVHSLVKKIMR